MDTRTSLSFSSRQFFLNGKPFCIFSGSIHYFRVVPEYWLDRLTTAKACGLNTVDTYVPWNLHEPKPGYFCSSGILNIRQFIKLADQLGLYVILRPGPYICAEWDFGGLPSWLLADPDMKVRSNYKSYQDAVKRYFSWLLPEISDLQYSSGGPIIAVQVENEFGSFSDDMEHLGFIQQLLQTGITELLVTSDCESSIKDIPFLGDLLPTINGQTVEEVEPGFDVIQKLNDQYPLMVMELWTGWFDVWKGCHKVRSVDVLEKTLAFALNKNASVNLYMFHGGTNFGFMAGAVMYAGYKPSVTSYDYDAPVTEDGQPTEKFWKVKELLERKLETMHALSSALPSITMSSNRASTPLTVIIEERMSWLDLVDLVVKKSVTADPRFMETFTYDNGEVQSYGYVVYRKDLGSICARELGLTGRVRDSAVILVDGQTVGQVDWEAEDVQLSLSESVSKTPKCDNGERTVLDIVVENQGRANFAPRHNQSMLNNQRKGLNGPVRVNGAYIKDWEVSALDFCDDYINKITKSDRWTLQTGNSPGQKATGPALYRGSFHLTSTPADYFIHLDDWHKGVVIVNGFNLGRYWSVGPQRSLYLPAPILHLGCNHIFIFEEELAASEIILDTKSNLG